MCRDATFWELKHSFSWISPSTCISKMGDKPQGQRIPYLGPYCWSCGLPCIHVFFTQGLETPPLCGERSSVSFPHHESGSLHLTRPIDVVPHLLSSTSLLLCSCMARGPVLDCVSCTHMASTPGKAHPLPSLLPPFHLCGQSGGILSGPEGE